MKFKSFAGLLAIDLIEQRRGNIIPPDVDPAGLITVCMSHTIAFPLQVKYHIHGTV